MKRWGVLLIFVANGVWALPLAAPASVAPNVSPSPKEVSFDYDLCDDVISVAEELVELELSGVRWQGEDSRCLNQSKFTRVLAKKVIYGDAEMLEPKVILQKGKTFKVDPPVKNGATDIYTANFYYLGKKKGKSVNIKDSIQFSIYSKATAKTVGCALLIEEPVNFVMREECLK